jgi:polysaccharide deacetylase 2 family uncharacterized protein YibQ
MLTLGLFGGIFIQRACVGDRLANREWAIRQKGTAKTPTDGQPNTASQGNAAKSVKGLDGLGGPANAAKRLDGPISSEQKNVREANGANAQMPRIALVIDDLGQAELSLVQRLCNLDIPLTVAVLPFLQHSRNSAAIANQRGKEVILHMPMEPLGYPAPGKNPGLGAVLSEQPEAEVRKRVRLAMNDIPHAVGLNNHMGSRITPDAEKMAWVLSEVKKGNWYFLDSRTGKDTVALEVARKLGVPSMERKVFLDDDLSQAEMVRQWERALALARQEGQVVIIGHIHPETLAFLEALVPTAKREAKFSYASELAR